MSETIIRFVILNKMEKIKIEPSKTESAVLKVMASLEEANHVIKIELDKDLLSRLSLLEVNSQHNIDSRDIEKGGYNVLQEIANLDKKYILTKEQIYEFRMAALLHDIGKTGPPAITRVQQLAVVKTFAFRGKIDTTKKVSEILEANFKEKESKDLIFCLKQFINTDMSMRDFYDSHARWGFDVLDKSTYSHIPDIIKKIAVLHHMDKKGGDYTFGLELGDNPVDIIRQRVLMIIDQYQARISRALDKHEEAILHTREDISKNIPGASDGKT